LPLNIKAYRKPNFAAVNFTDSAHPKAVFEEGLLPFPIREMA